MILSLLLTLQGLLLVVAIASVLGMLWIKFFYKKNRVAATQRRSKIAPSTKAFSSRTIIDNRASFTAAFAEHAGTTLTASLPKEASSKHEIKSIHDHRIMVYLKALKDTPYGGYELMQSLTNCGMCYGEMDIFHRYETPKNEADPHHNPTILFSLAAATTAGTFDLTKMGAFFCSGLVLFFSIKQNLNPLQSFDSMLGVAEQLLEDLGGTILDENHQELSAKKILSIKSLLREGVAD